MTTLSTTLEALKQQYSILHTRKEDTFWVAKMGLNDDTDVARREASDAEIAWHSFLQNPARLSGLRELENADGTNEEREVLAGWIAMLSSHVVESREGRKLSEELVEMEGALQSARAKMKLGFKNPATGELELASSNKLALMMRTDPDAARRQAAYEGLLSIEPYVIREGFLEIVKKRNQLARLLGYVDYYDWRVSVVERMNKGQLFTMLDDLARRTKTRSEEELAAFERKHGAEARQPWNFIYLRAGAITKELDPYFRFAPSLERWMRAFTAMGVRFRGATLTLDLVDRKGKYENGFMHGPETAFFDNGNWRPARINFTANAVPGQSGSGIRATETLFHEGGHAAHFANILSNAPCFSQEFAPTSVAYAETQSMFMDSILGDADFRLAYATDATGKAMPMELIERAVQERQPFRAWDVRAMLTVPFAERALYELRDEELTEDRVRETFRRVERELQSLEAGTRPVLAVPHLLAGESSAYYHGYVLAEMGVYQTREFFMERDGHIVDNPDVGPELARHYWAPGNAIPFHATLESLTGRGLSADALVRECNRTVEESIERNRKLAARVEGQKKPRGAIHLDATIRVVHGTQTIGTSENGYEALGRAFSDWIEKLEG